MDIRSALKGQYHAGLAMLRETVALCPEGIWLSGEHPRGYWRIAYHATFYTHLYTAQSEDSFRKWEKGRDECRSLAQGPEGVDSYSKADILEYIDILDSQIDAAVDALDLDAGETGFSWYPNMSKLDHQLMNLRHLQGHVGQMSELLMANGIESTWMGIRRQRAS
jgi:hypothetical protein